MPELPEVETVIRGLREQGLEQSVIRDVTVNWPRMVAGCTPARLGAALRGRTMTRITRRGKNILIHLDDGQCLHVHLRMTGKFRFAQPGEKTGPHDHVVIMLTDKRRLVFNDTRKFGRFRVVRPGEDHLAGLGPDALDKGFTSSRLRERLAGTSRMIKPLLLDQSVLAGLGNIYVDESLWAAGIHPQRAADTLTPDEINRLYQVIRSLLRRAVARGGTSLGSGATNFYSVAGRRGRHADRLNVFRREGEPCPRCGDRISRMVVGQRGTHYCPSCQHQKA